MDTDEIKAQEYKETSEKKQAAARAMFGSKHMDVYTRPDVTKMDVDATEEYIATLPDLQNGPMSLIKGSKAFLPHVGIHNFRLPLKFYKRDDMVSQPSPLEIETSVTGTVSLEAQNKGINMSRIVRSFYEFKDRRFSLDLVSDILENYRAKLGSIDATIFLKISYPILQKSLRSGLEGWQYYDVVFEVKARGDEPIHRLIHFDFVYSSACPCSFELSEHAREYRNVGAIAHSQRSVARVTVECAPDSIVWIEDLKDICANALSTETQVMVKREDEQAFAELNYAHVKFVEDAVRIVHEALDSQPNITDFRVVASHNESLHSHNAVAVATKFPDKGLHADVDREVFNVLGLR